MKGLNYIFSTIFLINSTLAQCPWQRDVPDLQTSCLCAYNLGNELSVQCDQVSDCCCRNFDSVATDSKLMFLISTTG